MEKLYIDCDRCGQQMQITGGGEYQVISYARYKNANLCARCNSIRIFDDENPILYPIDSTE